VGLGREERTKGWVRDRTADIFRIVQRVRAGAQTAPRFVDRIRDRCRRIGFLPYGGRPRDDLDPGLRKVPFERKAVIAYKVSGDVVEIISIFHGGRDYEAVYRRQPRTGET
jgi:toxin ParE1/3/4